MLPTRRVPRATLVKWVGRAILGLGLPILILTLVEWGLRLTGTGYFTGFFIPDAEGRLVANPRFGDRFFGPEWSRPPLPLRISPEKDPGTTRVFVLGASAIRGEPDPVFGPSRVLEAMLSLAYPERRFEVVNTGMTAINSHVVLPIARECAEFEADLAVVYLGNNEVIGPWGPGSVFGRTLGMPWVRWADRMRALRSVQVLAMAVRNISNHRRHDGWNGMAMFRDLGLTKDDPQLTTVRHSFAVNLHEICRTFTEKGIPVILSTVAVNLLDQPPLLTGPEIPGETAGSLFRRGREAVARGRLNEGSRDLVLARDLDLLRFRADSAINRIIREVAAADPAIILADAERAFGPAPGSQLFHEHVHLTFAGSHRLAEELFARIAPILGDGILPPAPSFDACAEWLGRTPFDGWVACRNTLKITGLPPFSAAQAERDTAVALEAWASMKKSDPDEAVRSITSALQRRPGDILLRARYAELLSFLGQDPKALAEWDRVLAIAPFHADWLVSRSGVLIRTGHFQEARKDLHNALLVRPTHPMAGPLLADLKLRETPAHP